MNEADEKLVIELVDLHAGISGSGLFTWNRSDVLAVAREAIRLTRESDVKTLSDFRDEVRVVNTYRNRIGQHTQFALDSLSDAIEKVRRLSREGK